MIVKYNIRLFWVLVLVLLWGSSPLYGQREDSSIRNHIRQKAYAIISEEYERYATINSENALYSFLRLFVDADVQVYNDLLGLSFRHTLSVNDYAQILSDKHITTKRVHVKNLYIEDEPAKTEEGWKVVISFDKEISYYNVCGIYFSSREFYGADYRLTATILYDEMDDQCRISRIEGAINSSNMLPMDYMVLKQTSNKDLKLTYHQRPIAFNSNQQAILPGTFDSRGFDHPYYEASRLSPNIDGCYLVTMKYLPPTKPWRIKPYFGIALGKALIVKGDSMMNVSKHSSMNFGADFGYKFYEFGPLRLSAFTGIGVSTSSLTLTYKDSLYETSEGEDADGQQYCRYYKGLVLNQTVQFVELNIPLYMDIEVELWKILSLYADLGVRFNINIGSKVLNMSGYADAIYGVYSEPEGLILDERWGYNGFLRNSELSNLIADKPTGKPTVDFMGNIGLRCDIPQTPLAVDLGLNYLIGMKDMLQTDKTNVTPVIYNTLSEERLVNTEHVNLYSQIESMRRNSLMLHIGLLFKF